MDLIYNRHPVGSHGWRSTIGIPSGVMDGEHDDGRLLEDCQMGVLVDARSTVLTKRRSNTQYMYLFTCTCVMSFSRVEKCRSKNNNKPGGSGAEVGWRMHPRRYSYN